MTVQVRCQRITVHDRSWLPAEPLMLPLNVAYLSHGCLVPIAVLLRQLSSASPLGRQINFRAAKSIPGVSCLTAASALRRQVIKDPSVAMASLVSTTAFVVNLPKLNVSLHETLEADDFPV